MSKSTHQIHPSEKHVTNWLAESLQAQRPTRPKHGVLPDLITGTHAIEVKRGNLWSRALGQALAASKLWDRHPALALYSLDLTVGTRQFQLAAATALSAGLTPLLLHIDLERMRLVRVVEDGHLEDPIRTQLSNLLNFPGSQYPTIQRY